VPLNFISPLHILQIPSYILDPFFFHHVTEE
jgi:hypothetical protein